MNSHVYILFLLLLLLLFFFFFNLFYSSYFFLCFFSRLSAPSCGLRCSEEVKIVEVSEPGHCSYEAVVQSAGACGKKIRCSKDKWPRFKTNGIARMLIGGVRCPRKKKRWCCGCGSQDRNSKMGCPIGEAWVPTPAVCPSDRLILSHTQMAMAQYRFGIPFWDRKVPIWHSINFLAGYG